MKILIRKNDRYYKDLEGQEFDITEKFDLLHDGIYFIKGREDEKASNWFSKSDCEITDKNYLDSLQLLRINERLDYYISRLNECKTKSKLYESGKHKEEFEGQNQILLIGSMAEMFKIEGKIEILRNLMGITIIDKGEMI